MKITWLERKLSISGGVPGPSSLGPEAFGLPAEQLQASEVSDRAGFWGFDEVAITTSPSELEFYYIASRVDPSPLGRAARNALAVCENVEAVRIEYTFDAFPSDDIRVSAFAFDLIPNDFTEAVFEEPALSVGVWYNIHYAERHRAVSAYGILVEDRSALRVTVIETVRVDSLMGATRAVSPAALKRLSKFCLDTSNSIENWYREHSK